jgi:hypothetical protein
MSEELKLGSIIPALRDVNRDAVHIAVAPVFAGERLVPGDKVVVVDGHAFKVDRYEYAGQSIGVVDPFLTTSLKVKDRFWLYLNPGSITSLRHEWTHPALDTAPVAKKAKKTDAPIVPVTVIEDSKAFEPPTELLTQVAEAKEWLTVFGDKYGVEYDELLESAHRYLDTGEYYYGPNRETEDGYWGGFSGGEYIDDPETFWRHFQTVTGRHVAKGDRDNYFTCSC